MTRRESRASADDRSDGKWADGPSFSNSWDTRRWSCPPTPWHWGSRWVLERARLDGNKVVLDVGAGRNPLTVEAYAKAAVRTLLLDSLILPQGTPSPKIARVRADAVRMPMRDGSVDVVTSVSVLEHLSRDARRAAMREIARVLRPGGRAVLSVGNFLGVNARAARKMATLPFFVNRGCAVEFPVSVRDLAGADARLKPIGGPAFDSLPGGSRFDEARFSVEPALIKENFRDYKELAGDSDLAGVQSFEVGLVFERV